MGGQIPCSKSHSFIHTRTQTHPHSDTRAHICSEMDTHMSIHTHTHIHTWGVLSVPDLAHVAACTAASSEALTLIDSLTQKEDCCYTQTHTHPWIVYTSWWWHEKFKVHHISCITEAHTQADTTLLKTRLKGVLFMAAILCWAFLLVFSTLTKGKHQGVRQESLWQSPTDQHGCVQAHRCLVIWQWNEDIEVLAGTMNELRNSCIQLKPYSRCDVKYFDKKFDDDSCSDFFSSINF